MVNKEAYKNAVKNFPDNCDKNHDIVVALRMGYQIGYIDRENKFKKDLENI